MCWWSLQVSVTFADEADSTESQHSLTLSPQRLLLETEKKDLQIYVSEEPLRERVRDCWIPGFLHLQREGKKKAGDEKELWDLFIEIQEKISLPFFLFCIVLFGLICNDIDETLEVKDGF